MSLTEFGVLVSIVVAVLTLVRGIVAIVGDSAKGVYLIRHRGFPTDADLAAAPNLRWHTPGCAQESSTTFEVRVQCSVSTSDAQGADAVVTSSEPKDSVGILSFNDRGTHRVGEFTFRIQGRNTTIAQVTRRISWRLVYFDTQGRFGYVTDGWADVAFDGNEFQLNGAFMDLSGPRERHRRYRALPKAQRRAYEAMFRDRG